MPTSAANIMDRDVLAQTLLEQRKKGRIVVFTNGCFDLVHVGHVRYLQAAKKEGDLLVVGLNSDDSMRRIKGSSRPIVHQEHRAEVLAALACVDYVTIFDEADPAAVIETLQPDVLVKGADWDMDQIIGADTVQKRGGRVVRVELTPDASTSGIIDIIIHRHTRDHADCQ